MILIQLLNVAPNSLGPVVQSVVSLTSSSRVISLTVLADSIQNILIFFAEKMWVAFALQKLLTFFQQKFQHICVSLDINFNESLTNDIVSFEQLGPVKFRLVSRSWNEMNFYRISEFMLPTVNWINIDPVQKLETDWNCSGLSDAIFYDRINTIY